MGTARASALGSWPWLISVQTAGSVSLAASFPVGPGSEASPLCVTTPRGMRGPRPRPGPQPGGLGVPLVLGVLRQRGAGPREHAAGKPTGTLPAEPSPPCPGWR